MKRTLPAKLSAYSMAAGAAVLGASGAAEAGLKVYDYRSAIIAPRVEYFAYDQTLVALNVKTGDFQYVYEVGHILDGANEVERYNQDGFVDNNLIPDTDLTDDMVWFSHRDVKVPGKGTADAVVFETSTGGAGGQFDADGVVYSPVRGPDSNTWSPHDWYWADQSYDVDDDPATPDTTAALPYPADLGAAEPLPNVVVNSSLSFNDSSPTGYTGAVTSGFGGSGHGNGTSFGVSPSTATIGFKLEEADGTHYGWVAFRHNGDRVHQWVHGWAYQTTPGMGAELRWTGDPDSDPGDFDDDGFINADDIDALCDQIGVPYDAEFDLDDGTGTGAPDGVVDDNDLIYLIETLIEWDNGVDTGVGTKSGDFNLDGLVNATDLAIMKGTFGTSGVGYADGNANCDIVVNATDLAILKGTFGFAAPTGGVPEPMTIGLLAVGACLPLFRRKRR